MADDEPQKCRHGNDASSCQFCASDGFDWLRRLGQDDDDDDQGGE